MSLDALICQSSPSPTPLHWKDLSSPFAHPVLLSYTEAPFPVSQPLRQSFLLSTLNHSFPPYLSNPPPHASLLTLACGRLRVRLLVVQALAVHRDATVTVELFSLRRRRLVRGPAVGSLLVLFAAVPPGARGRAQSQGARAGTIQVPKGSVL